MSDMQAKTMTHRTAVLRSIFTACALVCVAHVAFPPLAYAYVDPSVMTYTIQALAGVAVALGAVAGVAFRRTRKVLMKALNIDENAGKEVEGDVHRTGAAWAEADCDEAGRARSFAEDPDARYAKKKERSGKPLPWPKRIAVSLVAAAFLAYTVFVVAPYEIVASNSSSLVFGLSDIWAPIAVGGIVITVCLALVLSIFRGKVFDVAVVLVVALGVCAYVQVMFLNTSLPTADGASVVWGDYTTATAVSAAVWIAVVAAFVGFAAYRSRLCRGVSVAIGACLIIVQSVAVASLFLTPQAADADTVAEASTEPLVVTEDGLYSVSSKENVIVFILDKFDTFEMEHLLDENPDLLDPFTGFTYFPDSTGSMVPTMFALPYLVTGELPQEGEEFTRYIDERYTRSTFLEDIAKQGYDVGIYSDSLGWGDIGELADKTVNIHPLGERRSSLDVEGAVGILYQCALYRDLPWVFKPPFWFYTDQVNDAMVVRDSDANGADTPYTMNDLRYYDMLANGGLKVEDGGAEGDFRLIHLNGSHEPYVMDENCQPAEGGESTRDEQSIGALGIVEEYIGQLKEKGLYENSTIIVMADHGDWYVSKDPLTEPTSPLMLAKPAQSKEDSEKPCVISDMPVSHADLFPTVIDAVGGDGSKYGSTMFEIDDKDRARYYYMTTTDHSEGYVNEIIEFEIDGPMSDFDNWHLTGRKWYYDSKNYTK